MTSLWFIFRRFVMIALLCAPVQLWAQDNDLAAPEPPSSNDLHEFTRLLADQRIQTWIADQANSADVGMESPTISVREQFEIFAAKTGQRVQDLGTAWAAAGNAPAMISERWNEQVTPNRKVRSLTFIMIFLFLGAGLEWLLRQYANPIRKRLEHGTFDTLMPRVYAAFSRAALSLSALLVFAVGSIGAFGAFDWPPLLYSMILNALASIVAIRVFGTVLILFLAPYVPALRLVPIDTSLARQLGRTLFILFGFFIAYIALIDVFKRLSEAETGMAQTPDTLAMSVGFGLVLLLATLVAIAVCFRAVKRNAGSVTRAHGRWRAYVSFLACITFVLWLFDMKIVMWNLALIGGLIPVLRLLRMWVDAAFDRAIADNAATPVPEIMMTDPDETVAEDAEPEQPEIIDPYETYRPIAQRLVRFAAIVCVGLLLALIWNLGIFVTSDRPNVAQQVFRVLLDSAAALLIADLVWVWAKTAIDRRLSAYSPPVDGSAPGPEARMATLLPLLRVVLMVTLLAVVIMSILSSIGVNIAPIIAGASVLGIAIGFGAQSLVKDVVSGIFFLIDDAFRVGEYVEIDQLRGTVEKISIRSLQIRHHRGAVHTLPFGELKSMTNHSRDWVIMKLEFRVPFDTDLKLVKKLIKQVGAELKANETYGDSIIETLKSQGVRRMEEFNMVVGVKFMTRPGEQWLVRRDAYQSVRDIFNANGIRMAERNVKVEIEGGDDLTPNQRRAATAAAQEAAQNQLPPGPIPDEP
ncbi:MAG: small-conductance mechanosensitive channel [Ascidiaceihabitans sp.]|jgi:small-conductance mechanosensitive channel